jgi:hypothetical protein
MTSLPREVINEYGLNNLAVDGKVYIEIQKGMYGLPHAVILVNELLQLRLAQDGYRPTNHIHGLRRTTRDQSHSHLWSMILELNMWGRNMWST